MRSPVLWKVLVTLGIALGIARYGFGVESIGMGHMTVYLMGVLVFWIGQWTKRHA